MIAGATVHDPVKQNGGVVLVAALLLVAVVGIVTATVLQTTSTEVQISGNYKRSVEDFYAAEAGLAEARVRLWKAQGTAQYFVGGTGVWTDPLWTAYIVGSADWSLSRDPGYVAARTNVFPVAGRPTSKVVQPNSLRADLSYWVKIRHKTESDAERSGHASTTPHYVDGDGRTSRHSRGKVGNIIYFGYPSATSTVPVSFTTRTPTPWLPVERVTAHGGLERGGVVLEEEIIHLPGPPQLGALYASGGVSLDGEAGVINGHDACGVVGSLPPVLAGGAVMNKPRIQFAGVPAGPRPDSLVLNLGDALTALGGDVVALSADQTSRQLGTVQVPGVFLAAGEAFAQPSGIRIRHTSGEGILLVNGNATLEGEVRWNGMILVTGTLFLRGEGNGIVVRGGVWAGQIQQQAGSLSVHYDSCRLQAALLAVPVQVRTWREVF